MVFQFNQYNIQYSHHENIKPPITLKHLELQGCVLTTVATDALVLKHQAISNHSADKISDQFLTQWFVVEAIIWTNDG